MDDSELRSRFIELQNELRTLQGEIKTQIDGVSDDVEVLKTMLNGMSIQDAAASANAKLVADKLELATRALADAAQSMHANVLVQKSALQGRGGTWERKLILLLLGIIGTLIAGLVGMKLAGGGG